MAFPSNIGTKQDTLETAWSRVRAVAGTVKSGAQSLRDQTAAAGGCSAGLLLDGAAALATYRSILQNLASFPGLQSYARTQVNDATLDLAASFSAMVSAMDAVTTWIKTNFPQDGNGFLLRAKFANDGTTVDRVFTQVQVAGLLVLLDALIATID